MTSAEEALRQLLVLDQRIQAIDADQVLSIWAQAVGRPGTLAAERAERDAHLAGLRTEYLGAPQVGEWLTALEGSVRIEDPDVAAIVRIFRHHHDHIQRVPVALARALGAASSAAFAAWQEAREARKFAIYLPSFERMIALKREEGDVLRDGLPGTVSRHDVFFAYNDPGLTTADYRAVMATLSSQLQPLIDGLEASLIPRAPLFVNGRFPAAALRTMAGEFLDAIGFDRQRTRFDAGSAPMCCRVRPGDTRLVLRCSENELEPVLLHAAHEHGHGAYALGFDDPSVPVVFQDVASISLSEGCARLFDGVVCQLPEFWTHHFGILRKHFPTQFAGVSSVAFSASMKFAVRSGVRAMTDDLSFPIHLGIRADIEIALLDGSLEPRDVPDAFDARLSRHFGNLPEERRGALADPHWAANLYGRYPSYPLGSVWGAQLFAAIERDIPDVRERIGRGDVTSVPRWMTEHVYRYGRRLLPTEIMERATGAAIDAEPWIALMRERYDNHVASAR
jgi:carboxypeptidase Taq